MSLARTRTISPPSYGGITSPRPNLSVRSLPIPCWWDCPRRSSGTPNTHPTKSSLTKRNSPGLKIYSSHIPITGSLSLPTLRPVAVVCAYYKKIMSSMVVVGSTRAATIASLSNSSGNIPVSRPGFLAISISDMTIKTVLHSP
jgi:hypothetical protein